MDIILFAGHLHIEFVAVALKVGLPKRVATDVIIMYIVFPSMTSAIFPRSAIFAAVAQEYKLYHKSQTFNLLFVSAIHYDTAYFFPYRRERILAT